MYKPSEFLSQLNILQSIEEAKIEKKCAHIMTMYAHK